MLRILSVSVVLFVFGSPLWAQDANWYASAVNRATGVREELGSFTSREKAQSWFKAISILKLENGEQQWVGLRVYERQPDGGVQLPRFVDMVLDANDKVGTAIDIVHEDYEAVRKRMFGAPGLQGYADNVADAYKRAADAKKTLLNLTGSASDAAFKEVNGKIAEYNRSIETAQSAPGGSAFARIPKMTLVTDELVKKAEEFKAAAQEQLDLRSEQQKLDDERTRLEQERPAILAETRDVKALEQEVQQLRNHDTEEMLVGRSTSGSYKWARGQQGTVAFHFDTANSLTYRYDDDSALSGSYSVSGNRIKIRTQGSDQEGTISGNEITLNLSNSGGNTGRSSSQVSGGDLTAAVNAKTQAKQEELSKRKDALNRTKAKYLEEKASYDQKAAQYASRHKKLKTNGERLKEFAYKPHSSGGQTPRTVLPRALQ